jgi:hypothetical protein
MSRRLSTPAPLDDDDLLGEILLRLPPQPSSLPRASLVCARWRSVLSDPQFHGRFRKRHGKPPLLGFFTGDVGRRHVFSPALRSPDRIPAARFSVPWSRKGYDCWDFRGCRHGLAVLVKDRGRGVVVWDPLTGQHRHHRVPFSPNPRYGRGVWQSSWRWHPAVMCTNAEHGHVHGDCFSSPFKLVLMCKGPTHAFACVYNSVSGVWGNIISTATTSSCILSRPGILVGNALHWLFRAGGGVLVFDTEKQSLGVIDKPADIYVTDCWSCQLLRTGDDGNLGLAVLSKDSKPSIQLWKRQSQSSGVVEWVLLQKTIQLEGLFESRMFSASRNALMVGYDEDSNEIVLSTYVGVFILQIESKLFRTVSKRLSLDDKMFYPYKNFYTAGNTLYDYYFCNIFNVIKRQDVKWIYKNKFSRLFSYQSGDLLVIKQCSYYGRSDLYSQEAM